MISHVSRTIYQIILRSLGAQLTGMIRTARLGEKAGYTFVYRIVPLRVGVQILSRTGVDRLLHNKP
jgi:hypothetical protein